jgi:hypothetical protein
VGRQLYLEMKDADVVELNVSPSKKLFSNEDVTEI